MTVAPALINLHNSAGLDPQGAGSIAFGAIALIAVALATVATTYRRIRRAHTDAARRPRRGTSAALLGAIAAVVLLLSSVSQRQLASLTIVSHAQARTMTVVNPTVHHHQHRGVRRARPATR